MRKYPKDSRHEETIEEIETWGWGKSGDTGIRFERNFVWEQLTQLDKI